MIRNAPHPSQLQAVGRYGPEKRKRLMEKVGGFRSESEGGVETVTRHVMRNVTENTPWLSRSVMSCFMDKCADTLVERGTKRVRISPSEFASDIARAPGVSSWPFHLFAGSLANSDRTHRTPSASDVARIVRDAKNVLLQGRPRGALPIGASVSTSRDASDKAFGMCLHDSVATSLANARGRDGDRVDAIEVDRISRQLVASVRTDPGCVRAVVWALAGTRVALPCRYHVLVNASRFGVKWKRNVVSHVNARSHAEAAGVLVGSYLVNVAGSKVSYGAPFEVWFEHWNRGKKRLPFWVILSYGDETDVRAGDDSKFDITSADPVLFHALRCAKPSILFGGGVLPGPLAAVLARSNGLLRQYLSFLESDTPSARTPTARNVASEALGALLAAQGKI